jgi:hypothetical protein
MSFSEPQLNEIEEQALDDKRTILASAVAMGVLLLFVILLPASWMSSPFQAFLYGAGACLLLWTVAFFAAFRHGSNWMALGAFVALLLVGLGGTSIKYVRDSAGASYDSNRARHRLMETLYARPGRITVVSDVGEPSMAVTGRYLNKILADRNRYSKIWDETGMTVIIETLPFSRADPMLQNCGRFAPLATVAKEIAPQAADHAKTARLDMAKADLNKAARAQMTAEFDAVQKIYLPMQDRLWALRGEVAAHIQTRCNIMARGRWVNQGQLNFTDEGDFKAFNANAKALSTLLDEEASIQNIALRKTVDFLNAM